MNHNSGEQGIEWMDLGYLLWLVSFRYAFGPGEDTCFRIK